MSDGNVETTTPLINVTEPQHWLHHDRDYSGWHAHTCQCYGCRCNRGDEPVINTLAKMERAKEMRRKIESGELSNDDFHTRSYGMNTLVKGVLVISVVTFVIALLIWIHKVNKDIEFLRAVDDIRYQREWEQKVNHDQ